MHQQRATVAPRSQSTPLSAGQKLLAIGVVAFVIVAGIVLVFNADSSPSTTPTDRRTAFRAFTAQMEGAMQQCDDASAKAQASFQAVAKGGDALPAYQDAGTAHDACSTSSVSIDTMSVPGAISDANYHLDDARQDYANSANIRSSMWNHVQSALQNPSDLSAQSGVLSDAKNANQYETLGTAWIVEDAMTLTVPLAKITPVVPTPLGG